MPYSFIYDLTRLSQGVLKQVFESAYEARLHKVIGRHTKKLVQTFKIDEATGLNLADAITLVEDLVEVQVANALQRQSFEKADCKALLLPHCARARMDKRCMADFDDDVPTYNCQGCRDGCLINKATALGKKRGYDVYVIPGGACVEKILKVKKYDGVVGVACGMELKMGLRPLKKLGIPGQGVFLTKNGCANTNLNLQSLERIL
ncbi:MAG: DUF116 domain-containing protein [Candidatus Bathyarchaeota archaeon]|nr:MAG: DUF116 domain-containing protein [Candidatus Bathyarchaeota archaeon]